MYKSALEVHRFLVLCSQHDVEFRLLHDSRDYRNLFDEIWERHTLALYFAISSINVFHLILSLSLFSFSSCSAYYVNGEGSKMNHDPHRFFVLYCDICQPQLEAAKLVSPSELIAEPGHGNSATVLTSISHSHKNLDLPPV
jgi:hypothetical protein